MSASWIWSLHMEDADQPRPRSWFGRWCRWRHMRRGRRCSHCGQSGLVRREGEMTRVDVPCAGMSAFAAAGLAPWGAVINMGFSLCAIFSRIILGYQKFQKLHQVQRNDNKTVTCLGTCCGNLLSSSLWYQECFPYRNEENCLQNNYLTTSQAYEGNYGLQGRDMTVLPDQVTEPQLFKNLIMYSLLYLPDQVRGLITWSCR